MSEEKKSNKKRFFNKNKSRKSNQTNGCESCSTEIGVKIRHFDKIYSLDEEPKDVKLNQYVIVQTNRGTECGQVKYKCKKKTAKSGDIIINKVIRVASEEDIAKLEELEDLEEDSFKTVTNMIKSSSLKIKIISVEYVYDQKKAIFHYKKLDESKKVNLNDLNKQLCSALKVNIEFRQVGPRGEAKILGGVGNCGRGMCCANWLFKSKPVTVKIAKQQGLPINIPKLSGVCGRLMCCLQYEKQNYESGRLIKENKELDSLEKEFNNKSKGNPNG